MRIPIIQMKSCFFTVVVCLMPVRCPTTNRRGLYLSDIFYFEQIFGDLDGIQGGTLLDLVADGPERQAVRVGQVFADTSHVNRVFAGDEEGHWVDFVCRIVLQDDTLGF